MDDNDSVQIYLHMCLKAKKEKEKKNTIEVNGGGGLPDCCNHSNNHNKYVDFCLFAAIVRNTTFLNQ